MQFRSKTGIDSASNNLDERHHFSVAHVDRIQS